MGVIYRIRRETDNAEENVQSLMGALVLQRDGLTAVRVHRRERPIPLRFLPGWVLAPAGW